MNTLKFQNNDTMPAFGLGTWNSQPGEVYDAIQTAIQIGYRHIDCALVYGNQKEIGQSLKDVFRKELVNRSEMWITSKLWNNSHSKEDVIPALKQTLSDLQLEYLDLYLVHWPVAIRNDILYPRLASDMISLDEVPLVKTWEAMEQAKEQGLTRHIGVSNFGISNLNLLLENSRVQPEMNQVESHPYLQQNDLLAFCKAHHIHFTAYCPLGSANRPERLKTEDEPRLLDDPIIKNISNARSCTPAQILISWALHRGVSVIPKSTNPQRISENFNAQDIELSDQEIKDISTLEKNHRYISGSTWVFEDAPYTIDGIFK